MRICVFLVVVGVIGLAQTFPVDKLEIVGNTHIPTPEILGKLGFKEGDIVDREKVLAGVKAIADMGYFARVTPEVLQEEGKVVVRYRVVEYPKIQEVVILGVPPEPKGKGTLWSWIQVWVAQILSPPQVYEPKVREILKNRGIKPGEVLNIKKLREGLQAVLEEYQKKDLQTVQVSQEVDPGEKLVIRFEQLPVVAHKIQGLFTVPLEETQKLITVPLGEVGRVSKIRESFVRLSRSVYFSKVEVTFEAEAAGVTLVWKVTERVVLPNPTFLRGLVVEGVTILSPDKVQAFLGPFPSGMANNFKVLQALRPLFDYYQREGYFLVEITGHGVEDGVLKVRVREGELGRIEITGNTRTADWVILRVLGLRPGQLLTEVSLAVARQALMALGYFSDVTLTPTWENEKVVLAVEVKELERLGSMHGSVSFSPEGGGLVGNISYSQKNIFGTAQDLSFTFSRSLTEQPKTTWNLGYTGRAFPGFTWVQLDLYRNEEEGRLTLGGRLTVSYPLADYLNLTLGFTTEASTKLPDEPLPPRNVLSIGLVFDNRDNPFFPRTGQRAQLSLEKAGTFAPGVEYLSLRPEVSRFWPFDLGDYRGALAMRALLRIGWDLPTEHQFTLGGVDSVRGAKKVTTDRMFLLNAEFRVELTQGVWLAPFLDFGMDLRTGTVKVAPGLETAVNLAGMFFRLSMSWPTDREPTWVPAFEFGMSPMF